MMNLTPPAARPSACTCGQAGCPACDADWQRPHVRRPDIYGRNARTYRRPGGGTMTYIGSMPRRRRRKGKGRK